MQRNPQVVGGFSSESHVVFRRPLPLTTVELQKIGASKLRISSDRVMTVPTFFHLGNSLKIAEDLYNKGFISYPRTETDQFQTGFNLSDLIKLQTLDHNWGDFAKQFEMTNTI